MLTRIFLLKPLKPTPDWCK